MVDERSFSLRHPPKRPLWWTNGPFASVIHENGLYGGRTALFPSAIHQNGRFGGWSPFPDSDLPGQRPFSRTVTIQNRGPSTPGGVFPEGCHSKPGTIHTRGRFPGRSPLKTGDHPHRGPISRKVNVWSGAGRHKATCHPRLGGACEGAAMCRKGRRGSPVPPRPATKRISAPPPLDGQEWHGLFVATTRC